MRDLICKLCAKSAPENEWTLELTPAGGIVSAKCPNCHLERQEVEDATYS